MRPVRWVAVWLALAVAMVVQGMAREALVAPAFGALRAHQMSSLTGAGIVILGSVLSLRWLGAVGNVPRQLQIGLVWVAMTIVFEFGFGHYVVGHDWEHLVADYDVTQGRLWLIVLAATGLAPWIAGRFVEPRPVS